MLEEPWVLQDSPEAKPEEHGRKQSCHSLKVLFKGEFPLYFK